MSFFIFFIFTFRFKVKEIWCPFAFLVSFKLETDEEILLKKSYLAIEKTKSDFIVANILQERYDRLLILNNKEIFEIKKDVLNSKEIENALVDKIVNLHNLYIDEVNK